MNGADSLCDTLLANGVTVCFANPGTSEMHFVAALDRKPGMRCVLGLFEGVATGAADGYGRMMDKPAATLLHLGPGLANGLANLHNAKRARTPMVNVVGEHATWHLPFDAPLTTNIEALARPMSDWVHTINSADEVSDAAAAAIGAAFGPPGQIATLILPANAAWDESPERIARAAPVEPKAVDPTLIREAAEALRSGRKTVIILSGMALREKALAAAGRIAEATGARLIAQQSNGRMERGAGRVAIDRVPYIVDRALATFSGVEQVILIGAKAPVAFFAYPGKPSSVLPPDCWVIDMAEPGDDLAGALDALADELAISRGAVPPTAKRSTFELPRGALLPEAIATAVAVLSPEGAIWVDETISSGRAFFPITEGAAPHDFLQLTGGAIGIGLPLAAGAAIACPDRKVVLMQADGSAMYTVQALWTHARERLDIVTIIFANRRYAILHNELKAVGAAEPGRNARRMLDFDDPAPDWVKIANGMGVEAARAADADGFCDLLASALSRKGPFLIEAVL